MCVLVCVVSLHFSQWLVVPDAVGLIVEGGLPPTMATHWLRTSPAYCLTHPTNTSLTSHCGWVDVMIGSLDVTLTMCQICNYKCQNIQDAFPWVMCCVGVSMVTVSITGKAEPALLSNPEYHRHPFPFPMI